MSKQFSTLLCGALFLSQSLPGSVKAQTVEKNAPLITKTYPVIDLIQPCDTVMLKISLPESAPETHRVYQLEATSEACEPMTGSPRTTEDKLMKLIADVAPPTWSERGGKGRMDFFPLGQALVVNQTEEVQRQISDLLVQLRRMQESEVSLDVRVVRLPEENMPILHRKGLGTSVGSAVLLFDESETPRLLKNVESNPKAQVLQSPRITVFDGQAAKIKVKEPHYFVTGVEESLMPKPPVAWLEHCTRNTSASDGSGCRSCQTHS